VGRGVQPAVRPRCPAHDLIGEVGARVVAALGEPAARELLEILDGSDAGWVALIGRLHVRDGAALLAELLMDLEDDVGEIARLLDELRQVLTPSSRLRFRTGVVLGPGQSEMGRSNTRDRCR
jgi:hypothetical protein